MSALHPWFMWFFTSLFFAFQFIIRVFPGLCVPEIMSKFQVDATEFGFFNSVYYFGYAGMQIPVALLLDRFGPRLIVSLSCLTCSLAIFLFYWTDNWTLAILARFLIGACSATGFLGVSKVISLWFPYHLYARMVGISFSVGLLGAIYGEYPVSNLMSLYGWENVLLIIGTAGLTLTGIIAITVQSHKPPFLHQPPSFWNDFKSLFTLPTLFLIAGANFLMVGPLEGFADVWGVPYLMTVFSFEKSAASLLASSIFTGMLIGGPILAFAAEKLNAFYQVTALCGLLMASLFTAMLLSHGNLSYSVLYVMMFMVGVLCCYQVLVFSIGTALVPSQARNITVAFLNCINMLGGSFFHTLIGTTMDLSWTGHLKDGQRIYEAHSYTYALAAIPVSAAIGGCIFLFLSPWRTRKATARPDK